jgi:hypothetical protein
MAFLPIGPDFVFAPRDPNFKRLSLRNENGAEGLVQRIGIDQTDPNRIYIVVRPSSGGTSVHRTDDGGSSWTSLFDTVMLNDPASTQATCVAVNPLDSNYVFVGCDQPFIWTSNDAGTSWTKRNVGTGDIRRILVDPRTAANPATAVALAASAQGLYRSIDGGVTWTQVLAGNVTDIAASFAADEAYYASVWQVGLFHATSPTGTWTNLSTQSIGLPLRDNTNNFDLFAIDLCRTAPHRAYVWMAKSGKTMGLFTSISPTTAWTAIVSASIPEPGQGLYSFGLAVAPNSPGDGANDVLFFTSVHLHRSVDAGKHWTSAFANALHDDQHCVAFAPDPSPMGVVPDTYVGCDGGIGFSDRYADPAYAFDMPDERDAGDTYQPSGVIQNLGHGLQNTAILWYASDPEVGALSYVACQDTCLAAGAGALGWRSLDIADGYGLAVSRGYNGMKAWYYFAVPNYIKLCTDNGEFQNPIADCRVAGDLLVPVSNMTVGLDQKALAGVWIRDDAGNKLTAPVTVTGVQAATPALMTNIIPGVVVFVDDGSAGNAENVKVTATTMTTFTANFTMKHAAGAGVVLQRYPLVRLDQDGNGTRVSQDFGPAQIMLVAADPVQANVLYLATNDQKLWMTTAGATAGPTTIWSEISNGKPAGLEMRSIAFDPAGNPYVLLARSVTVGAGEFMTTTPLFQISGGAWVPQSVANLPSPDYGKMVFDPVKQGRFYALAGNRVYQVTNGMNGWQWVDISDGLPGSWIYDLWVGNIGSQAKPRVLLRAAATARGVFESDVTEGAVDPPVFLYVRANLLDQRRLDECPNGVPNPYEPQNPAAGIYHYQSVDVKVDARNAAGYFQTDPEDPLPLSHVAFDQLRDGSRNLPQQNSALVHVQVHNRARKAADNVRVWALYANASAGVPSLAKSASNLNKFPFWNQFQVNGKILPSLPADSPWKAIGSPLTLSGITADHPQVGSWNWTIPALPNGSLGHYCIAVFVHSSSSLLSDASLDMDDLALRRSQIGLKNVHIGPALPPAGSGGGVGTGASGASSASPEAASMREYVEFHNPTSVNRRVALMFDLRALPRQLSVSVRLSRLVTARPLAESIRGAARRRFEIARFAGDLLDCVRDLRRRPFYRWLWAVCMCLFRRGRRTPIPFDRAVYDAEPGTSVVVDGVDLAPFSAVAAELVIRNTGSLPPGSEHLFQVQQELAGGVVGGSEYRIRIAGRRPALKYMPPTVTETNLPNFPLWARDIAHDEQVFRHREPGLGEQAD